MFAFRLEGAEEETGWTWLQCRYSRGGLRCKGDAGLHFGLQRKSPDGYGQLLAQRRRKYLFQGIVPSGFTSYSNCLLHTLFLIDDGDGHAAEAYQIARL